METRFKSGAARVDVIDLSPLFLPFHVACTFSFIKKKSDFVYQDDDICQKRLRQTTRALQCCRRARLEPVA
jgi:hypothetical protein